MSPWRLVGKAVLVTCAIGVVAFMVHGERPSLDPADVSGAGADICFDCKDMKCDWCPRIAPCKELYGYCQETVRHLSQFCAPRINGQWEDCKNRVDDSGSCVTRLSNPCTHENPICWNPVDKCGPMVICIPEGVCIP